VKSTSKRIIIFIELVILITFIIFAFKYINNVRIKKSINEKINNIIMESALKDNIDKYNLDGYYNSHVILYTNNKFNELNDDEIYSKLKDISIKIETCIRDTQFENNIQDDVRKLTSSEKIDVISTKGNYTFNFLTLTLPSGEKFANKEEKNNSASTTNNDSDLEYNSSQEPSDNDKTIVWVATQKIITDNLKSPNSAKFPFSYNSEGVKIQEVGLNTFTVSSYVDANNSFGAKIRNYFTVTIIMNGNSGFIYKDLSITN
jgi:hypothetical protein